MLVRGAFNAFLRPGLRRDFRDAYREIPQEYNRFLNTGTMDRAEVEATTLGGLPRMVKRGEAEPITYVDPLVGDKVVFTDDEWALGFSVSKRLMEDDQYGKANQNAKWLGRSARLTQEYQGAALLDDAFAGAIFTGVNGEPLISATHANLGLGGTYSNLVPGNPQLSVAGLQAAYDLAAGAKDHNGDPIIINPNLLVVGIADEWTAIQIARSELEPFTSDNQVNALRIRGGGLNYTVSHYKNQTKAWFFVDRTMSDAWFLFRIRPEFEDTYDFDTKSAKFSGRQRLLVYFYDPRGWIGSNPP
jgi:phage major head subunit gpT-like protein